MRRRSNCFGSSIEKRCCYASCVVVHRLGLLRAWEYNRKIRHSCSLCTFRSRMLAASLCVNRPGPETLIKQTTTFGVPPPFRRRAPTIRSMLLLIRQDWREPRRRAQDSPSSQSLPFCQQVLATRLCDVTHSLKLARAKGPSSRSLPSHRRVLAVCLRDVVHVLQLARARKDGRSRSQSPCPLSVRAPGLSLCVSARSDLPPSCSIPLTRSLACLRDISVLTLKAARIRCDIQKTSSPYPWLVRRRTSVSFLS